VVLEQCEGLHPFSFRISPGLRFSLHTAAPGKLFLAHLETKKRIKIMDGLKLKKFTPHTITTKEGLEKEVLKAAQDGYAVDYEEEFKGQVCVGAPVLGKNAKLIGSVWMVAPTSRLPKSKISETAKKVMVTADKISQSLGNQFRKVA
jgi:DNA-binding IclR family transcriptional regulator